MERKKSKPFKQYEKFVALKDAVMLDSPDAVSRMLKEFGELEFTAQALGLACRYRGVDMVRALVEGGAKFTYDLEAIKPLYKRAIYNIPILYPDDNFAAALLDSCGLVIQQVNIGKAYDRPVLPLNNRLRILSYLYKTAEKTGFDSDELLFFAYLSGERKIIDLLKKHGAVIPQKWIDIITNGNSGDRWLNYCWLVRQIPNEEIIPRLSAIISEIGGQKLHITDLFWEQNKRLLNMPGYMKFLLEKFDFSKMNKTTLMKEIILFDDTESLEIAADNGWLKQPKKRDEMIAFASEKNKTECTAWLLDFKNRTVDLAAERARAEKKAERELNAAPDSVTALKALWNYKKREDGTIIITGYKGNRTEITVPERIGKDSVTAIGEYAFSPDAKRLRAEQREFRETITEVKLPDSITEIGNCAFLKCRSLVYCNIPTKLAEIQFRTFELAGLKKIVIGGNVKKLGMRVFFQCHDLKTAVLCEGVEEIDTAAFYYCTALETIEIPSSVTKIASDKYGGLFYNCYNMTVLLHKGSYADEYCILNKIPLIYKE